MRSLVPPPLRELFGRTPTTDLYFRHPVGEVLRAGAGGSFPAIRAIAPNVYMVGRTGIISRTGSAADLDRLGKRGVRRIVYIADDDFEAGAADPNLPARYRARLAAFAARDWPLISRAAGVVVVSSRVLGEIYGPKALLIHPAWHRPPAATDHFSQPKRIEIVHFGTGSHGADLAPLAPVLADVLRDHPGARMTLFTGGELPQALRGSSQLRVLAPMRWWRYKLHLPRWRFHLAIYPLLPTRFNAARSANKLFEQAITGAAALMTPNEALREAAGPELSDVFVEGGPSKWRERIETDLADLQACGERAERTRQRIIAFDPLGRAARQWLALLDGET